MPDDLDGQVAGLAALRDPVRRSLYRFVVQSLEPVGREEAARAVGVGRTLAAFHLDKLAEEGLVEFEFRRLTGRSGPGAGRPAKLYRRSDRQIAVSLPPREYDLAGALMARAIENSESTGRSVRTELDEAAFGFGRRLGEEGAAGAGRRASRARLRQALIDVLQDHGFEPRQAGDDVTLANCPFHALALEHTDLICAMNLSLMRGVRAAIDVGSDELLPELHPRSGQCCVRFCGSAG